ncbi:MAG TPA: NAD(P)-binding domain-containing protein [Actinomycetota bacterium]|nr:NAD(P)-binding domain-containing protein [Actinomycetota bacterium]
MAKLKEERARRSPSARPFPPGDYPVVVLGSGPGGLQFAYSLGRLGIKHAALSADGEPAGMFRRFPFFQRLISWTKPYAPHERGSRQYEWFDWNSLSGDVPEHRATVPPFMDGTSYFPSRAEMQRGMEAFAERAGVEFRYGCRWESTSRDGERFVVVTSDGEYRCDVLVVAVGMTEPWKPDNIPGLEDVPHYVETDEPEAYADRRVFIIGKRNSGFELADGLLPWARQIVLASPRPARISVLTHSVAAARARYMQPYEDHVLAGGTLVLDASIERVDQTAHGYRVTCKGTTVPGEVVFDVDRVIAATGFGTPLRDLPDLGLTTFSQGRLPGQTAYWESASIPGIFFAGSITQGSIGLKKYGRPSGSAAVHGARYNARVLAEHLATTRFGVKVERPSLEADDVVPYLLQEMSHAPELWNQQAYLSRVVTFDGGRGIVDEGIVPLAHFVDSGGPDAVAATVETSEHGEIRPAVYIRRDGSVDEQIMEGTLLHAFDTKEHHRHLSALLKPLLG